MIVFKTFLKVLNKCKMPIILYTIILLFFGVFNIKSSDNSTNFVGSKPNVLIVNNDCNEGITSNLIAYIEKNSHLKAIKEDAIDDALFYRDVNYIIYIPYNYRHDFLNNQNPTIEIKRTSDYLASLAELNLERYLKVAAFYKEISNDENKIINLINDTLENETEVTVISKVDIDSLTKVTSYYNFTNYCFLAGCIYIICLVIASFKNEKIVKRTIISSLDYKKHNRYLLFSNSLFAFCLWFMYVIISIILFKQTMFSLYGYLYMINSFVFTSCVLTLAFLIGNLSRNKNAINGIVNVIALGSSFLCGSFVPLDYLPSFVIKLAHFLPSFWYIKTNEFIKTIDTFNLEVVKILVFNLIMTLLFASLFVIITNIISKKRQTIG